MIKRLLNTLCFLVWGILGLTIVIPIFIYILFDYNYLDFPDLWMNNNKH